MTIYGGQTWALKKKEREKIERTEMKMLRWILGTKLMDRVRNKEIKRRVGVENVSEISREMKLKRYGHVERWDKEEPVRKAWEIKVEGKRPRGRPKLKFKDVVLQHMQARELRRSDYQVRGYGGTDYVTATPNRVTQDGDEEEEEED